MVANSELNNYDDKINIVSINNTGQYYGGTVVPPYVGMARKQNGGYNASISIQTLIFHLVVNSTRLKTVRSALWRCPNSTVVLRLLENVVNPLATELFCQKIRNCQVLVHVSTACCTLTVSNQHPF